MCCHQQSKHSKGGERSCPCHIASDILGSTRSKLGDLQPSFLAIKVLQVNFHCYMSSSKETATSQKINSQILSGWWYKVGEGLPGRRDCCSSEPTQNLILHNSTHIHRYTDKILLPCWAYIYTHYILSKKS